MERKFITALSIILCAFFILRVMEDRETLSKPTAKASVINTEPIIQEAIYAGRYKKVDSTEYNSLGLPVDRYWLTHKEWRGKHIKNMPINKDKKRLLLKRFKSWKKDHMESFIERMARTASEECDIYPQIPPSLIIAQSIIESNFGLSKLAVEGNNLFGHKYRGKDADKFIVIHDDDPNDRFVKYESVWFCLRAHTKGTLMKKYYTRIKGKPNLSKWLAALCGGITVEESKQWVKNGNTVYATSCMTEVCYAQKLKNIIECYNLDIFD